MRTHAAAVHRRYSKRGQAQARKLKEVALPAAARVCCEGRLRAHIVAKKSRAHLLPHLEGGRSDGGTEPGAEFVRGHTERKHRRLEYTTGKSPPATMGGSHCGSRARGQEYRQAVSHLHGAYAPRHTRQRGVRTRD